MRPFRYEQAVNASGAVAALAEAPAAMFLGGGTNLVDLMRLGVARPAVLVDVSRLAFDRIEELPGGGLRIGATVRNSDLAADRRVRERYPVLAQALLAGASGQLRNLATTGGNLLQRTRCAYFQDVTKPCNKRQPGSGCPAREGEHRNLAILGHSQACVATHPSDLAVALAALDAVVHVQGPTGSRTIPIPGLHRLPGDQPQRDTVLEHAELITSVELPPLDFAVRSRYRKVRDRASFAFAVKGRGRATRLARDAGKLRSGRRCGTSGGQTAARQRLQAGPCPQPGCPNPRRTGSGAMTVAPTMAVGASLDRLEGRAKVTGEALYSYDYQLDRVAYAAPIQASIAKGEIRAIDATAALAAPGVLAVLSHENAPRLMAVDDGELFLFQSTAVAYRGQFVAAVVAESLETAREAAGLLQIDYTQQPHDVQLDPDRSDLRRPEQVNGGFETDSELGDFESTFPSAAVQIDRTYTTPAYHNNPMEPHATVALWEEEQLTLYDSNQGAHTIREGVAQVFGLPPEQVRVITEHVGGGFGAKGRAHPPQILAAMAAKLTGRPVKVAITRQQMFAVVGYRTPTIQRVQLGADTDGRLTAIAHDAVSQTSTLTEFAEQSAVATRIMYAAPNRRTTHRLARLDVPTPAFMRAPGECPGMFALESAIDELAIACDLDPIELRIRNEPDLEPETAIPFSSRNLLACLREGASRFGWEARDPVPRSHVDGRWLVGTGVAASTYPAYRRPSAALARAEPDGSYRILIDATDLGTGARTALTQIAADALEVTIEHVRVEIGDSALPRAPAAAGSMGTASWGSAIDEVCRRLRESGQREASADTTDEIDGDHEVSGHAFGAQFAEVRVDLDTGEVRVPRLLGIFAAGRIINPKTARSQLIGGMTMGLGMALLEESVMDAQHGDYLNHDFAQYHVPACADVQEIQADWIDEHDPDVNQIGVKGIGEIGIVGTAAAVANAVHHATGIRIRDLPIRLDKLLRKPTA